MSLIIIIVLYIYTYICPTTFRLTGSVTHLCMCLGLSTGPGVSVPFTGSRVLSQGRQEGDSADDDSGASVGANFGSLTPGGSI